MEKLIYAILISFLVATIVGWVLIPILRKLKLGQHIREEGIQSHKKKAGTPTFGGIIFIVSTAVTMLLIFRNFNSEGLMALTSLVTFGLVGFLDDTLKTVHKNNLGLKSMEKFILLLIPACIFSYYAYKNPAIGSFIILPFSNMSLNLGVLYIPFTIFFYTCTTNAVNFTDGLDGLATSITILVMTFFTIVSFSMGRYSLAMFCGILAGSLLGFLRYNVYPARVIMGDIGSLALGGAVATVAIILKMHLIILLVGGIYVIEAMSTAIQISWFKITGKRVFKMAPIHHSFELSGWHEVKIVTVFSIVTTVLCIIGFLALL